MPPLLGSIIIYGEKRFPMINIIFTFSYSSDKGNSMPSISITLGKLDIGLICNSLNASFENKDMG